MHLRATSSIIALLATATPVLADVTPAEVWQSWSEYYKASGYTVTEGSRQETGDNLVLNDVVLTMEVIEHVADPGAFARACSRLVRPGGVMMVATLNRTLKSLALGKVAAEYVLRWVPAGTHDWRQFLKPDEIRAMLAQEPVAVEGPYGLAYDPLNDRWRQTDDAAINYMMIAVRSG